MAAKIFIIFSGSHLGVTCAIYDCHIKILPFQNKVCQKFQELALSPFIVFIYERQSKIWILYSTYKIKYNSDIGFRQTQTYRHECWNIDFEKLFFVWDEF